MYITTSRRASQRTRLLAHALAAFLGIYRARGHASMSKIAEHARAMGQRVVAIVGEKDGKPATLSFARIGKDWEWIGEIGIKVGRIPSILHIPPLSPLSKEIKYEGKKYKKFFDFPEPTSDDFVRIGEKGKKIKFSYKKRTLTIEVTE